MKTFVQPGRTVTVTAPAAVTSGDGLLIGALFGVAMSTAANGATVEAVVEGIVDVKKNTSTAIAVGDRIYWDNTAKECNKTATGNFHVGVAVAAAQASDTTVRLHLSMRVPASGA